MLRLIATLLNSSYHFPFKVVCKLWKEVILELTTQSNGRTQSNVRDYTLNVTLLQWAYDNGKGCELTTETYAYAAEGGNLKVLEWLRKHNCPWDSMTCAKAAEGGHLEVLKWLQIGRAHV